MKNKKIALLLSILSAGTIFLSACGDTASSAAGSDGAANVSGTANAAESDGASDPSAGSESDNGSDTSADLGYVNEIDKSSVMSISITADEAEWQTMLDNAEDEEYISADITINGTTIENVGIRPKGNSSLSSIARDETTDRYSFKISFDEYVDGQTWRGLDKLVLNSNYSDASAMKEYLSYDIMTYIGVEASLYAYADIAVNGESWGFYLAIEEVDGAYKQRAQNDEGELYKPESAEMGGEMPNRQDDMNPPMGSDDINPVTDNGTVQNPAGDTDRGPGGFGRAGDGVSLVYTDDNLSSYSAIFDNAETKTDETDHQRVVEAIKNLNSGTELEKYVDVDAVLRYLAAHTAVVNLDSYSGSMGHNYMLYENDGQISILPWDYNMAFGGFQSGDATAVVNFPIDTPVSGTSMEERPLISQLLAVPEYLEKYHQYLQEIIDGYFADGKFEQTVDELNTMIAEYVENDPTAFYTYEEYQAAVTELKELGALRAESIQGQLDGTVPATTDGQNAEPDRLIDASAVDMSALGSMGEGGFGGGFGGERMPGMPEGFGGAVGESDMETMRQAMEIIMTATDGQLTDEQRGQLRDLGLSDEQIEQMLAMPTGGGFGGMARPN